MNNKNCYLCKYYKDGHCECENLELCPRFKLQYEDIVKAFQLGLAFGFGEKHDKMDKIMEEIKKVITPQPKTGQWTIKQYQVPIENKQVPTTSGISSLPIETTACKIVYSYTHSDCKSEEYLKKYNYCPNCGLKMQ